MNNNVFVKVVMFICLSVCVIKLLLHGTWVSFGSFKVITINLSYCNI